MEIKQVKSSNIFGVGYDKEKSKLRICFKNITMYDYEEVPEEMYNKLLASKSIGSFFNQNIAKQFKYSKVDFASMEKKI